MPRIKELLAREVDRTIEEVIKVDQDDAAIIRTEIEEYVVTDSILEHYLRILERFDQTPANPHEGIGIWVSGFFSIAEDRASPRSSALPWRTGTSSVSAPPNSSARDAATAPSSRCC